MEIPRSKVFLMCSSMTRNFEKLKSKVILKMWFSGARMQLLFYNASSNWSIYFFPYSEVAVEGRKCFVFNFSMRKRHEWSENWTLVPLWLDSTGLFGWAVWPAASFLTLLKLISFSDDAEQWQMFVNNKAKIPLGKSRGF